MSASLTYAYTGGQSGSWLCPPDVTSITIIAIGGGGSGGPTSGAGRGGGGGGASCFSGTMTVTPGTSYSFSVGSGATASSSTEVDGGATTFGSYTASGGKGAVASGYGGAGGAGQGGGGTNSTPSGCTSYIGGAGGTGGTGSTYGGAAGGGSAGPGGGGGAGGSGASGNVGGTAGTAGSVGSFTLQSGSIGAGGAGVTSSGAANNGATYGGGGSGADGTNKAGGNGGGGYLQIAYTTSYPQYVQENFLGMYTTSGGSATVTLSKTPTAGNSLLVAVNGNVLTAVGTISAMTLGAGGSAFTKLGALNQNSSGSGDLEIWFLPVVPASPPGTIVVTQSGTAASVDLLCLDFLQFGYPSLPISRSGSSATSPGAISIGTQKGQIVVLLGAVSQSAFPWTFTPDANAGTWTSVALGNGYYGCTMEYSTLLGSTATAPTWSGSTSTNYALFGITLNPRTTLGRAGFFPLLQK